MKTAFRTKFNCGVICLLAPLCMLQARAQSDVSSDNNFLAKLQDLAPPVIRQCMIDKVKQLPHDEIASKAVHSRDAIPSDEAQAKFAVEYLSETCFSSLDIDPSPEKRDPWRSPRAFIDALQNHVLLESYDLRKLQVLVNAYNQHQDCLFGLVQPCVFKNAKEQLLLPRKMLHETKKTDFDFADITYPPRGYSQIKIIETTGLFVLAITLTDQSHTSAVDNGADRFKTVLFRQGDMSIASEHDARYLDLSERAISVLSEGAHADCQGTHYGDHLIVFDGATSSEIGRTRLPDGVLEIEPQEPFREGSFQLRVRGQQLMADPRGENCELPYWANHFDYRFRFRCDVQKKKCQVEKHLIRTYQSCANVGVCD